MCWKLKLLIKPFDERERRLAPAEGYGRKSPRFQHFARESDILSGSAVSLGYFQLREFALEHMNAADHSDVGQLLYL